jgi:hypothetical protein
MVNDFRVMLKAYASLSLQTKIVTATTKSLSKWLATHPGQAAFSMAKHLFDQSHGLEVFFLLGRFISFQPQTFCQTRRTGDRVLEYLDLHASADSVTSVSEAIVILLKNWLRPDLRSTSYSPFVSSVLKPGEGTRRTRQATVRPWYPAAISPLGVAGGKGGDGGFCGSDASNLARSRRCRPNFNTRSRG